MAIWIKLCLIFAFLCITATAVPLNQSSTRPTPSSVAFPLVNHQNAPNGDLDMTSTWVGNGTIGQSMVMNMKANISATISNISLATGWPKEEHENESVTFNKILWDMKYSTTNETDVNDHKTLATPKNAHIPNGVPIEITNTKVLDNNTVLEVNTSVKVQNKSLIVSGTDGDLDEVWAKNANWKGVLRDIPKNGASDNSGVCGPNEVLLSCATPPPCQRRCQATPQPCPKNWCWWGCQCRDGYLRNSDWACVPEQQCGQNRG